MTKNTRHIVATGQPSRGISSSVNKDMNEFIQSTGNQLEVMYAASEESNKVSS